MTSVLMVALGGALGSLARYAVTTVITRGGGSPAPFATAMVNVTGCAVAGLLLGLIASGRLPMTAAQRAFAFTGILGGFTTFSGIGVDNFHLIQEARGGLALIIVLAQVVLGFALLFGCYALARR
jgi:CrcB protein